MISVKLANFTLIINWVLLWSNKMAQKMTDNQQKD